MVSPSMGFLGALALGTTRDAEAQLGRLLEPLLTARGRAHLAGQAHLAKGDEALGQRLAAQAALDRQQHGQVGRRFADAHAAHGVDEHILVRRTAMPAWRCSTASSMARRSRSRPTLRRRGLGPPLSTRAWISTSRGRVPSSVTSTH
jgi:hypothetical protein